jgi:DNA primase
MEVQADRASAPEEALILAHYHRAAPLLAKNFPLAPLIVTYYLHGLNAEVTFSGPWHEPLPHTIPGADAVSSTGTHRYPACAINTVLWLAHRYSVGFMSWTPSPKNTSAVGVAHIVLKPVADGTQRQLREALLVLRDALAEVKLKAIPLLDGLHGAALFIPFADAPAYDAVRAWLHTLVDGAIAQHPNLLVHEKRPHDVRVAPRIECTVVSNAVGHGSLLPYSLNGTSRLPMVTPICWDELGHINNGDITAANSHVRLAKDDVYHRQAEALRHQIFGNRTA